MVTINTGLHSHTIDVTPPDRFHAERLYSITLDQIRAGVVKPNRGSFLCSRKNCGFWETCVQDCSGGGVMNLLHGSAHASQRRRKRITTSSSRSSKRWMSGVPRSRKRSPGASGGRKGFRCLLRHDKDNTGSQLPCWTRWLHAPGRGPSYTI